MTEPPPKIERFLRQNLRTTANRGGLDEPSNASLMHGSLRGLVRKGELPGWEELRAWAVDEGIQPDDVEALRGIRLAVAHSEHDVGQLTVAVEDHLVLRLTRDEARIARSALGLMLFGPFCNHHGHRNHDDPFWEVHTLTGFWPDEYRTLYDAFNARLEPPSDPADAGPIAAG